MIGGGGGGGYGYGGGGGGSFTILDFPYYSLQDDVTIEIVVGKGGTKGAKVNGENIPAQRGGDTIVKIYQGKTNNLIKEFVCYGGEPGEDYFDVQWKEDYLYQIKKGGNGGMNTKTENALMNAVYPLANIPLGGDGEEYTSGADCRIYYLGISGSGGGSNRNTRPPAEGAPVSNIKNNGGSFILYPGGMGAPDYQQVTNGNYNIGGGGGSTYFGKGGDGGSVARLGQGLDGEENSGSGGGGGSIVKVNGNTHIGNGGNGANGLVIIEQYNGNYIILN